jgi:hypothetical protein
MARTKQTARKSNPMWPSLESDHPMMMMEEDDRLAQQPTTMMEEDTVGEDIANKLSLYDEETADPLFHLDKDCNFELEHYEDYCPVGSRYCREHAQHLLLWGKRARLVISLELYKQLHAYKIRMLAVIKQEEEKDFYPTAAVVGGVGQTIGQLHLARYKEIKRVCLGRYRSEEKLLQRCKKHHIHKDEKTDFAEAWTDDGRLLYTPIRNYAHIYLLDINNLLDRHPWAKFLKWFIQTYQGNDGKDLARMVSVHLKENQCIKTNLLEITFLYEDLDPRVLITFRNPNDSIKEYFFFLYGKRRDYLALQPINPETEFLNLVMFIRRTVKNDGFEDIEFC